MNNQNGKNIQTALKKFFEGNQYWRNLLQYAGIFLYIYVAIEIIEMFPLPSGISVAFNYLSAILYFVYISGVVMSYAKNDMIPVFVVFAYKTIAPIISIIRWGFSFNSIIYIIVYGIIAYWAFKKSFQGEEYREQNSDFTSSEQMFCPNCGKSMSKSSEFCGNCGTKVN